MRDQHILNRIIQTTMFIKLHVHVANSSGAILYNVVHRILIIDTSSIRRLKIFDITLMLNMN